MKVIELTNEQYDELLANGEITVNGEAKEYDVEGVANGEVIYKCDQNATWSQILNKLDAAIYDNAAAQKVEQDVIDKIFERLINGEIEPGGDWIIPEGTKVITENGEYDVKNYENANVNIQPVIQPITVTTNGTYTVPEGVDGYSPVTVNTDPTKGFVFENYDSDGYIHTCRFVGNWTEIPARYLEGIISSETNIFKGIKNIVIPNGVTKIGTAAFSNFRGLEEITFPEGLTIIQNYAFEWCHNLRAIILPSSITTIEYSAFLNCQRLLSVTYKGKVSDIPNNVYNNCNLVKLYDFSHHTGAIPSLYSVASLGHASECVIKVPQALLSEWQSATNWADLTDVEWVGV